MFSTLNLPYLEVRLFWRRSTTMHRLIPEMIEKSVMIRNKIRKFWTSGSTWKVQTGVWNVHLTHKSVCTRALRRIRRNSGIKFNEQCLGKENISVCSFKKASHIPLFYDAVSNVYVLQRRVKYGTV
jgi:hypothetical protein